MFTAIYNAPFERIMFFILSIRKAIRTTKFGFVQIVFCRGFHGESSEKKSKFYRLSVRRYSQNKVCCFCDIHYFKNLLPRVLCSWNRHPATPLLEDGCFHLCLTPPFSSASARPTAPTRPF